MSDHSLETEKVIHLKVEREKRECRLCKRSKVQNEIHFLAERETYASQCELFYNAIRLLYKDILCTGKVTNMHS